MNKKELKEMVRGWFVGSFSPTAYETSLCEVGYKAYRKGEYESAHYHKIATEITLVVSGCVKMAGNIFGPGDIVVLEPGEVTDFSAISDSSCIVVKIPGALNDKYIA